MSKTCRFDVRCTPDELSRWKLRADLEGVTFSRYVRARIDGVDCMPSYEDTPVGLLDRIVLACKTLRGSI